MADHYLILTQQLAAALEAVPGTAETLAAANVKLRPFRADSPFTPDFPRFGNDEVAEDEAQAPDFVAGAKGGMQIGLNVKTSGVVGTEPAIGIFLEACGAKKQIVNAITIGAPAGGDNQFLAGETYSATGGKTGIIEATITGAGTLRYIPVVGGALAAADVVTVGTDAATASGTNALYAVKYTPTSTGKKTLTMQRIMKNDQATADQDYIYRLKGAMGNAQITWTPLDAIRAAFDFQGVVALMGAGAFLTPVTYESGTEPKFINATCQLNAVNIQPADIVFDFGNAVEMEPEPTTIGGTAGFLQGRIAGRNPTISVAPFRLKVAELDDLATHLAGTTWPFILRTGTSPQMVEFVAPNCQIRGWSHGERAGLQTAQLTLHIVRDLLTDNDWALYFR